jgi:hypothetical protein
LRAAFKLGLSRSKARLLFCDFWFYNYVQRQLCGRLHMLAGIDSWNPHSIRLKVEWWLICMYFLWVLCVWVDQWLFVPLPILGPPFSNYYFLVHHLVNRDDRHLLARGNGLRLLSGVDWVCRKKCPRRRAPELVFIDGWCIDRRRASTLWQFALLPMLLQSIKPGKGFQTIFPLKNMQRWKMCIEL